MSQKVYYVGPGADALTVDRYHFDRDGDGVDVEESDLAKALLAREDFQQSKPTRSTAKVEREED